MLQRPFELGADLVMHSSTKYFGGHSDVIGGAVIARDRGGLSDELRDYQATAGRVPSPFDCWLLRRSLTTLSCRVRAQTENAQRLADSYSVTSVSSDVLSGPRRIPGTRSRAADAGWLRRHALVLRARRTRRCLRCAARTKLFTRATSLGGVESLIEHRASVEGPHTSRRDNLLRLSIGLEHPGDLIADLDQALGVSG